MEQVITVRIIDAPQTQDGARFDVLADEVEREVIITDPGNDEKLGRSIVRGVLAVRHAWKTAPVLDTGPNVTVIGPAFSDGPPLPQRLIGL